jgi:hypothetical protein
MLLAGGAIEKRTHTVLGILACKLVAKLLHHFDNFMDGERLSSGCLRNCFTNPPSCFLPGLTSQPAGHAFPLH